MPFTIVNVNNASVSVRMAVEVRRPRKWAMWSRTSHLPNERDVDYSCTNKSSAGSLNWTESYHVKSQQWTWADVLEHIRQSRHRKPTICLPIVFKCWSYSLASVSKRNLTLTTLPLQYIYSSQKTPQIWWVLFCSSLIPQMTSDSLCCVLALARVQHMVMKYIL